MTGANVRAESLDMASFLPGSELDNGWKLAGSIERFDPKTLYQIVNGAASLYLSYDFKELLHLRYERSGDPPGGITVDLYDMETVEGGFGLYSSGRHPTEDFEPWGTQGYRSGSLLIAWKGRYYVHLISDDDRPETIKAVESLGHTIASKIPGDNEYPSILHCLPKTNRIPNTELYSTKDYLGYKFLKNTVSARYLIQSETATLFVSDCSTPTQAEEVLNTFTTRVNAKPQPDHAPYYAVTEKYLGNLLLGREGPYVYGAYSQSGTITWPSLTTVMRQCTERLRAISK